MALENKLHITDSAELARTEERSVKKVNSAIGDAVIIMKAMRHIRLQSFR